ncbi:MAG: hypothetical protein RL660_1508 [Bacteroidota bacterium]|jgi:hypothetical protein
MQRKKFTILTSLLVLFTAICYAVQPQKVITGNITGNVTWYHDTTYIIKGKVFVKSGGVLTINPGTLIKGDTTVAGSALIITRGAKIMAEGTPDKPIVFTANAPVGARRPAMWGGLVIAGNAKVNVSGGEAPFEGGNLTNPDGSTTDDKYGGLNDADNSGSLKYVRIEFAGYPYQTNNELNSLTLGAVGSGTTIDYVQCSYGFDDAFEFFGGTVNAKHLVAYRGNDDDFDTDFGYRGNLQFGVSIRDSAIADPVSGANGFESDNDGSGSGATPNTAATFSNFSMIGPKATSASVISPNFRSGMHIRRNSKTSVFNSIFMGFPTGMKLDGDSVHVSLDAGTSEVKNNIIAGCPRLTDSTGGAPWNITAFFNNTANALSSLATTSDAMLTAPYSLSAPNLIPMTGSPALGAAAFTSTRLSNSFFDVVTYAGAFGSTNWMDQWTEFDPQNEPYEYGYGVPVGITEVIAQNFTVSPNPANSQVTITYNASTPAQVIVYNAQGQAVLTTKLANSGEAIDITTLTNGVYFLSANVANVQVKKTFVVQR